MRASGDRHDRADVAAPNVARMQNLLLGGTDHFPSDRRACADLVAVMPNAGELAQQGRAFVRRAVRVLAEAGQQQFLDLGCGLPAPTTTVGSDVHDVAQGVGPAARVALRGDFENLSEAASSRTAVVDAARGDQEQTRSYIGEI